MTWCDECHVRGLDVLGLLFRLEGCRDVFIDVVVGKMSLVGIGIFFLGS